MSDVYKHKFTSAKADVGDATLVRPSNWNDEHRVGLLLTNHSGSQQIANAVCVIDTTQDDSFITTTTQGDKRPVVVVQETINNAATGLVKAIGHVTVNVQNAVARGDLLRVSATAGALESAGSNTEHTVAYATSAFAGPGNGTVTAVLFGSNRRSAAGSLQMFSATSVPFGWLLCDGTAVSRTTYADLFGLIGTQFGAGDGVSTFNLPNFKSRMPIGIDAADVNMDTMGEVGGSKTKTLSIPNLPSHDHGIGSHTHTTPNHQHAILSGPNNGSSTPALWDSTTAGTQSPSFKTSHTQSDGGGTTSTPSANNTDATGSGTAVDVMNPFIAVNFVIKW